MYCNQCGLELPDNYKFCPKCGAEIMLENKPTEYQRDEFTEKELQPEIIKKARKRINRQTILIGISVPVVLFILIGIVAATWNWLNGPSSTQSDIQQQIDSAVNNVAYNNNLTDTQKSIIQDMQRNCDNNEAMANLQSNSAAKGYHKMCYDKVYDQIQQFTRANNKTS